MKVYAHVAQGSEEWFAMRRGRPTASNFKNFITPKTGEYAAAAKGYIAELVGECFCPEWVEFAGNKHTDRGTELEPEARAAFVEAMSVEGLSIHEVEQVGFVTDDRRRHVAGCSPDGLIRGPNGEYWAGLELKCPMPKTHIGYVMEGVLPDDYKAQVHGGMEITGLSTWFFMSYFPGLQPFILEVRRDAYTSKLSACLDRFLIEYGAAREALIPKLQLAAA